MQRFLFIPNLIDYSLEIDKKRNAWKMIGQRNEHRSLEFRRIYGNLQEQHSKNGKKSVVLFNEHLSSLSIERFIIKSASREGMQRILLISILANRVTTQFIGRFSQNFKNFSRDIMPQKIVSIWPIIKDIIN